MIEEITQKRSPAQSCVMGYLPISPLVETKPEFMNET
jgi:hypothetical protein